MQRLHRLLDRRVDVEAVALVEIDVVGLQARQRCVDLAVDLLRGQPAAPFDREVELGREDVLLARVLAEDLAPGALGRALAVDVRGVEEVDPGLERRPRAGFGVLALDAAGVGEPGAERDLAHLEVAAAEPPSIHADPLVGYGLRDAPTRSAVGYAP